MIRPITGAIILGTALMLVNTELQANCSTSSANVSFGALSSFALATNTETVTAETGFKCSSGVLSLLGENKITSTISTSSNSLGTTPRLYNTATNTYLPYSICRDSGCGSSYGTGDTVSWSKSSVVGILNLFTGSDGSLPLYLRITPGLALPAGTYTDTIVLTWNWKICSAGVGSVCIYNTGQATSVVTVTLNVLNDCFIDKAPDVSFGSAAIVSAFPEVNQSIDVRCTLNSTYQLGFDNGNNFSEGWRRMVNGPNTIQYNIYKETGTAVWTTSNTTTSTGSGATQSIPYRVAVNPIQPNVPAGTYIDSVRVILTY
ncbi:spore coat U domain-containing protein [Ectopseudomonas mendocina]|uniref:Spore coat U domain-containing protein n=1 Tax=Ectopseudomonas mendocina TaxID=300 RepID=A0ABZ2RLH6_ECTME